jgi:hypothetical protein
MKEIVFGKNQYTLQILKVLNKTYGDSLHEDETDLRMAKAVVKSLGSSLRLKLSCYDISPKELKSLRKKFLEKEFGIEDPLTIPKESLR